MRTDDLIRAAAADHATRSEPVGRRLGIFSAAGLVFAAALFACFLRPRPDFATALASPRVAFKFAITLTLAASAGVLALRHSRPEEEPDLRPALGLVLVLLGLAVGAELVVLPPEAWGSRLVGSNALACLALVPLLSLPLLIAALAGLRHGAPARPARAGAVAGLFAGGLGAALYAAHCVDDSPLFVAAWYGLAIAAMAGAGAALGARLLRW